jgi:DNA-directed RNA polymerase subunit RPC12/RpoP
VNRLFWPLVAVALALAAFDVIEARWVIAPLAGLAILRVGLASFRSLAAGGAHIPDGPPQPVDPREEQVSYVCQGCGAELLLLVRGTEMPPRHCGERMHERREVARLN